MSFLKTVEADVAAVLKTIADIKAASVPAVLSDVQADVEAVKNSVGPAQQALALALKTVKGEVSVFGAALQAAGLASPGPNLESSLEVNPGSNDRG